MEFFEAVLKRHSYRGAFLEQPVPRADLTRIVEAGLKAPSACNMQTTSFIIVDDPLLVRQIGGRHKMPAMRTAQAFILCISDEDPEPVYEGFAFQAEDCAAAVENMLLAVTALGYASVWVDGWLRINGNAQAVGELLKLPPEKEVQVILPIGVPAATQPPQAKKPFAERAWFNVDGHAAAAD